MGDNRVGVRGGRTWEPVANEENDDDTDDTIG